MSVLKTASGSKTGKTSDFSPVPHTGVAPLRTVQVSGLDEFLPGLDLGAASLALQPKLAVNQPGDRYEQEADRIADTVMRMPEPSIQRAPT